MGSETITQPPTDPTDPPPVPPRTYQMTATRTPLWRQLIVVLLVTGAFSAAMIAVIKVKEIVLSLYYTYMLILFLI